MIILYVAIAVSLGYAAGRLHATLLFGARVKAMWVELGNRQARGEITNVEIASTITHWVGDGK